MLVVNKDVQAGCAQNRRHFVPTQLPVEKES
jgi:hypothetical protein